MSVSHVVLAVPQRTGDKTGGVGTIYGTGTQLDSATSRIPVSGSGPVSGRLSSVRQAAHGIGMACVAIESCPGQESPHPTTPARPAGGRRGERQFHYRPGGGQQGAGVGQQGPGGQQPVGQSQQVQLQFMGTSNTIRQRHARPASGRTRGRS